MAEEDGEWGDMYADDGPRDNQPQELLPCPFCGERPVLDDAGDVLCKKTKCLVHPFVIQSVRDGKPLNDPVMAWNARAACPDEVEAPDDEIVKIRHAYGGTKPAWFSEPHAFAQVATDMDRVTSTVAALRERIVALQEEREKEMLEDDASNQPTAAEVAALRAENERQDSDHLMTVEQYEDEITSLRAENEELKQRGCGEGMRNG